MIGSKERNQLINRGWLVVPNVVPQRLCEAVVKTIEAFLDIRSDDPLTWYQHPPSDHGIVPLHHGQALWDVRQYPGVHDIFSKLYQTEALWVSMDRVAFKPPDTGWEKEIEVSPYHWDGDPSSEQFSLQGLVYLRDTPPELGAFSCVPDLYCELDKWLSLNDSKAIGSLSVDFPSKIIGASAGSLVIWHRRMPHSSSRNLGGAPRWVQYVTMDRAIDDGGIQQHRRISEFVDRRPPAWAVRQKVPGQQIPEPGPTAKLTGLGRKLVGLDSWLKESK